MPEKPILFTPEMVRAVLDKRKTQTRRPVKPQPERIHQSLKTSEIWLLKKECYGEIALAIKQAPYQVGDKLWIRETWVHTGTGVWTVGDALKRIADGQVIYKADEHGNGGGWFPSIHMPKWAARPERLLITRVRVERVQDISEADARAEGIFKSDFDDYWHSTRHPIKGTYQCWINPQQAFQKLWDSIYAAKGLGWDANPWVFVYDFEVV